MFKPVQVRSGRYRTPETLSLISDSGQEIGFMINPYSALVHTMAPAMH